MSVGICIDGVAMRRVRDDGALVHIWHHDAALDWHQGNATHGSSIAGRVHRSSSSSAVQTDHAIASRIAAVLLHTQGSNSASAPGQSLPRPCPSP